ncbi:MAG: hypothetical protein Q6363_004735 [Candidatus Njordarchaeota archaeon]
MYFTLFSNFVLYLQISVLSRALCIFSLCIGWWGIFIWIAPRNLIAYIENINRSNSQQNLSSTGGAYIGILERTIIFIISLFMFLSGFSLGYIVDKVTYIFMGLFGIKGLYRFQEKQRIDWILMGTMLSLLIGTISSIVLICILSGF